MSAVISLPSIQIDSRFVDLKTRATNYRSSIIHILEVKPRGAEPLGDVWYFHGMGDKAENHLELFDEIAANGYRALGIDLPSHGQTVAASLNSYNYNRLGGLVRDVDDVIGEAGRPVTLAGWSFGGLLALRMAQHSNSLSKDRPITGLALHAPALTPRFFFGKWGTGYLDNSVITDNPDAPNRNIYSIRHPLLQIPFFGMNIMVEAFKARQAWKQSASEGVAGVNGIPTFVVLSSDAKKDRSIDATASVKLIRNHVMITNPTVYRKSADGKTRITDGNKVRILEVDAPHALDWSRSVGGEVRSETAKFAHTCVEAFRSMPKT